MVDHLYFDAEITLEAANKSKRTISIVAYSGGIMNVNGSSHIINLKGLELPSNVTLLDGHKNDIESVVGSGQPIVIGGQLIIKGRLANTEAGDNVLALLKDGVALQASVGVNVTESEFRAKGERVTVNGRTQSTEKQGGVVIVTAGELKEVSVVPMGADSETSISIAAKRIADKELNNMTQEQKDKIIQAEKTRTAMILTAAADFPAVQKEAIEKDWDQSQTENAVLQAKADAVELQAKRDSRPLVPSIAAVVSGGNLDRQEILNCATYIRMTGNVKSASVTFGDEAVRAAKNLKADTLIDLFKAQFTLAGEMIPADQNQYLKANVSNVSMEISLGSSANKVALDAYNSGPSTWRSVARTRSVSNFKDLNLLRMNQGKNLLPLAAGGTIKHGTLSERNDIVAASTKAILLRIDRKDIINDDLNLFSDLARTLGITSARTVNNDFWSLVLANLDSSGNAFFHADNNNLLTGGGSALDADALTLAIQALLNMVDDQGEVIDMVPATLIVPSTLVNVARTLVRSQEINRTLTTGGAGNGNPFTDLQVVVEPRLENANYVGNSATAWYLAAGGENLFSSVVFLNGQENPTVELIEADSNQLGMVFRAYHDFGAVLNESKACIKNAGS